MCRPALCCAVQYYAALPYDATQYTVKQCNETRPHVLRLSAAYVNQLPAHCLVSSQSSNLMAPLTAFLAVHASRWAALCCLAPAFAVSLPCYTTNTAPLPVSTTPTTIEPLFIPQPLGPPTSASVDTAPPRSLREDESPVSVHCRNPRSEAAALLRYVSIHQCALALTVLQTPMCQLQYTAEGLVPGEFKGCKLVSTTFSSRSWCERTCRDLLCLYTPSVTWPLSCIL